MNVKCQHCGRVLAVSEAAQGRAVKCPHCQQPVRIPESEGAPLKPGIVLGRYRIDRPIGRGSLAVVYRATDVQTGRIVALKVFAPHLARSKPFIERLGREAEALAKLSHPNIVGVLGKGLQAGLCYLAMEYVEGESLRARLRRQGPLPCAEAARLLAQVAAGLGHAHGRSILHRDIKPENVLIASDGTAKLADFGIARIAADPGDGSSPARTPSPQGAAAYLAPELAHDALLADPRADLYALGVLLHETLTGQLPVGQFTPASQAVQGVPPAVDVVIHTALAAQPEQRFNDADEFRTMLQRAAALSAPAAATMGLPGQPAGSNRRNLLIAAWCGAAVIAIAVIALLLRGHTSIPANPDNDASGQSASAGSGRAPKGDSSATAKAGSPAPPKRALTEAEKREAAAEELYDLASRKGGQENWRGMLDQLDLLTAKYSNTQFYAANADTLRNLRERALAELGGKTGKEPAKAAATPPVAEEAPLGLLGVFYDGDDFGQFVRLTRHSGPWFTWSPDYPGGGITGEHMSARFVGQLEVRDPGGYLLHFISDGGTRLYLDGKKVLDDWDTNKHPLRRVDLEAGKHPIWVEFKTGDTKASFSLIWSRAGFETQVPNDQCTWTPGLWQRVLHAPGRDPLIGMKPGPASETGPAEAPEKTAKTEKAEKPPETAKEAPPAPQDLAAKGLDALRPLWARRQYAEAAAQAKALAADPEYAAAPEIGKRLAEDAQALVGFWQAVEAGAAKLEPGESIRVSGIAGEFQKLDRGSIFVHQGAVTLKKALTDLNNDEIVSLARRGGGAKTGLDHLRLALFWLFTARPDLAKGQAELALAEGSGIDVSRYRPRQAPPKTTASKEPPAKEPPPKETKVAPPADATFDSALKDAQIRLERKQYGELQKAIGLALQLRRPGEASKPRLDDLFTRVVRAAVMAGKGIETAQARTLLEIAGTLRYKSKDIEALSAWLTKSSEPTLVEDFEGGRATRWQTVSGTWRVQDGHLVCAAGAKEARILLKNPLRTDYTFEFRVLPGGGPGMSHLGAVFRDNTFRRFVFAIEEEKSAFLARPDGFFDGVEVNFVRDQGRYAAEAGKTLHVAIRCLDLDFECYVDGDLWARGITKDAEIGRVGLFAQGAETRFQSVRLYKAIPVPEMTLDATHSP